MKAPRRPVSSLAPIPASIGALSALIAQPDRRSRNGRHETIHQTIRRSTAILEFLWARVEPARLSHVADAVGLDRSTTLRLLSSLEELGYVHKEPYSKTYRLGYMAQRLGARAQMIAVNTALALPFLRELAGMTGETVVGASLEGISVVYHCCLTNPAVERPLAVRTGVAYDAHACAMGKMLLGNLSKEAIVDLYAVRRLERHASRTIVDRQALAEQAIEARVKGFALELHEAEEGRVGVAVPVVNSRGTANMAIGIIARREVFDWSDRDALIRECRRSVSRIYAHILG